MRVVRGVVLGVLLVAAGATLGFLAALLRPRRYAQIDSARTMTDG